MALHLSTVGQPSTRGSVGTRKHQSITIALQIHGQQTKRILFIMPNFHSVSAGSRLPPQSATGELLNATQDSFDYSSFMFVGALAGIAQAQH